MSLIKRKQQIISENHFIVFQDIFLYDLYTFLCVETICLNRFSTLLEMYKRHALSTQIVDCFLCSFKATFPTSPIFQKKQAKICFEVQSTAASYFPANKHRSMIHHLLQSLHKPQYINSYSYMYLLVCELLSYNKDIDIETNYFYFPNLNSVLWITYHVLCLYFVSIYFFL